MRRLWIVVSWLFCIVLNQVSCSTHDTTQTTTTVEQLLLASQRRLDEADIGQGDDVGQGDDLPPQDDPSDLDEPSDQDDPSDIAQYDEGGGGDGVDNGAGGEDPGAGQEGGGGDNSPTGGGDQSGGGGDSSATGGGDSSPSTEAPKAAGPYAPLTAAAAGFGWVVLAGVTLMVLSCGVWCYCRRIRKKREQRMHMSDQANRVLGDLQMVPNRDLDNELI